MNIRQELQPGFILDFPGMPCRIDETLGMGSNAIVYKGSYCDRLYPEERHHVFIKELFPFHPEGSIRRGEDNRICIEGDEALAFYKMHKESFEEGNRIHLRLLENAPEGLGANLNSFELNQTFYTVLGCSGGKSLEEALSQNAFVPTLRKYTLIMLALLDALEFFHEADYLHLDISPDNMLLIGKPDKERVLLIDYNCAKKNDGLTGTYLSCKDGYSAPELEMNEQGSICEASDLYSVAAVFFRCLMGRPLTLDEMLQAVPPDAGESPVMKDVSQTVLCQVRTILKKGLCTIVEDRYGSIEAMRKDFIELLDRIDCVGITHWALWETGKRSIEEMIRINPSLRYVKNNAEMYPIRLECNGKNTDLPNFLEELLLPDASSFIAVSQGGMGKTTLLMKAALLQNSLYNPHRTAAFYVSLSDWREGEKEYIHSRMLSQLHFKRETTAFQSAIHELDLLLNRPLCVHGQEIPSVLLLLDGLNEAKGSQHGLYEEIRSLARMKGVRILAVSRCDAPELNMKSCRLLSLMHEDIESAAAAKGILLPQSETVLNLLKTPLVLSLYLKASEDHQQLDIENQDDLIDVYLESLYQKEVRELPENAPERWRMDVALHYVLPSIAAKTMRTGHTLKDEELLKVVEECYRVLTSRKLHKIFPQWIGHSRDILSDAKSAEEWYGMIVHDLLWQRLGLLVRDSHRRYHIFHQFISESLAKKHGSYHWRISQSKFIKYSFIALIVLCLITIFVPEFIKLFRQPSADQTQAAYYPEDEVQSLLESSMDICYTSLGACNSMHEYLNYFYDYTYRCEEDPSHAQLVHRSLFESVFSDMKKKQKDILMAMRSDSSDDHQAQCKRLSSHYPETFIMPWSYSKLAYEDFLNLAYIPAEIGVPYSEYLSVMDWLLSEDRWKNPYAKEFYDGLIKLVETDMEWINVSYAKTIAPELSQMEKEDPERYRQLKILYPGSMPALSDASASIDEMKEQRSKLIQTLDSSECMQMYRASGN